MTSKAFGLAQLGNAFNDGALSNRNKIINGAMVIDQRNAGAAVTLTDTAGNEYAVDRFPFAVSQASKVSVQRNAGGVTPPAGFSNYLGVTSLTAWSLGASDYLEVEQRVEGLNAADLSFGAANAKTVTVSFWVRGSIAGTYGFGLRNAAFNRSYATSYTISAANTWEYKTLTILGDTSGTWLLDNGTGVRVTFPLSMGSSNVTSSPNTWQSGAVTQPTGCVNMAATNGATWQITGVQLEAGDTATPFEHRSYGQELALCQRYFKWLPPLQGNFIVGGSSIFIAGMGNTLTDMRASPTFTLVNGAGAIHVSNLANIDVNSLSDANINYCRVNTASSPGAYAGAHFNAGNLISLSAEL